MPDNYIITPYFLEKPVPELASLPFRDATLNDEMIDHEDPVARFTSLYPKLTDFVHRSLEQGHRPVSIAGDCCNTIAVMAGLQRANMDATLIWIDAHGDFNTHDTTPSGFLGGMPLAMIAGLGDMSLCETVDLTPLDGKKIILTDGRDLDPGEADLVENSNLLHVANMAELLTMELPDGPLYVHFDTDIINLDEMSAVAYPAPGGPSAAIVTEVLSHLGNTGQVAAASMTCWTPELDNDNHCQDMCVKAFKALLG